MPPLFLSTYAFRCLCHETGDLPPELGKLTQLEELLLNSNAFSGESLSMVLFGSIIYAVHDVPSTQSKS